MVGRKVLRKGFVKPKREENLSFGKIDADAARRYAFAARPVLKKVVRGANKEDAAQRWLAWAVRDANKVCGAYCTEFCGKM